ncbi:MAG TPA: restriction endonuclease subunit S [Blastocatellia bacterium]|nr:restriction endonuclease subunit S [Blastocatellia bacterium]
MATKVNEWRTVPLGELVKFASGGTPSREVPRFWNGEIPWLSAKDLKKFRLNDSIEKVTCEGVNDGTRLIEAGSVLILVRGMTLLKDVPVGVTERAVAFNQDLKALIPNREVDGHYLGFYLAANKFRLLTLVDRTSHGAGRLSSDLLQSFEIELPGMEEQRKIVDILLTWDRAVDRAELRVAAESRLKRGLLEQLLTGRKRLDDFDGQKRESVRLGNVTIESKLRNYGALTEKDLYAVAKAEGMVPMRKSIRSEGVGRCKIVRKNWFVYDPMRLNTGSIAKWSGPGDALAPPDYVVFKCDESRLDPEFLNHFRLSHQWAQFAEDAGTGSVRMRTRFSDLASLKLALPPLEEQRRIAAIINACDRELDLLRRQLAVLKRQKQGLMQKLLTGQIRVKVGESGKRGPA